MNPDTVSAPVDFAFSMYEALAPVIVTLAGWVSLRVSRYMEDKISHDKTRLIMTRLNVSVLEAVLAVHQRQVELLRKFRGLDSAAGRRLSEREAAELKESAHAQVMSYWGPKGVKELAKVLGYDPEGTDCQAAISHIISTKIESTLHDIKASRVVRYEKSNSHK